ncbi:unnamed protein product [Calicophoron daubneyi]|uniref:Large ribosomal subunit protein P2 n=1 Tax=Calicophoron daubneyi TaxID=300641 RepID=A0AAV2T7C5_CALDB
MKYLAAYMLCQLGGKEKPTASDVTSVLESVGIEHDSSRLELLLSELHGKDIHKLTSEGLAKMASVPMGGGAPGAAPSAAGEAKPAGAASGTAAAPAKEEKEEKKEESESEDEMGFDLFN